jgi:hypothetical protein
MLAYTRCRCSSDISRSSRLHLLRLPQDLLGAAQALLVLDALGDVVDELIGADALAIAVAQRAVAHLVDPPVPRRVAELADFHELFASQRARPQHLHRCLLLRLRRQHLQHAFADLRAHAEDAFELPRG